MMPEANIPSENHEVVTSLEMPAAAQKAAREKQWLEENREAIEYWNDRMEREGLILERFRVFGRDFNED